MKKFFLILPLASLLFACGPSEEEKQAEALQDLNDELEAIFEENNELDEFIPKSPPTEGSNRAMVIGTWDPSNSDVRIEITKDRYYTYDGDTKVWDQDWEMTTSAEYHFSEVDENGTFLHVINGEGESFYVIELIDVEEGRYTGHVNGAEDVVEYIKM